MFLRSEEPGDESAIATVHEAAFGPQPGGTVEARLVAQLRADESITDGLSLVAVVDARIVGHVVCSAATIATAPCVGLGPLGVLPQWQRQGVGSALMHGVLAAADAPHFQIRTLQAWDASVRGAFRYSAAFERLTEPPATTA